MRPETFKLEPLHRDDVVRRDASAAKQGPDSATVANWLAAVSDLHRTAASSDWFSKAGAAEIAVRSTGLDAAMILAPRRERLADRRAARLPTCATDSRSNRRRST